MKKLSVLLLVLSGILSGCIAYDAPYGNEPLHRPNQDRGYDRDHGGDRGDQDRNHDSDREHDRR